MKNVTYRVVFIVLFFTAFSAHGQKTMVVGEMVNRPNAILVLNPTDNNQGVLIPQITSANRLSMAPTSPAEDGLLVFDITDKSFYFWKNGAWTKGLGEDNNQALTYDPTTNKLSLSNGGSVDLAGLNEIPAVAGQAGKYITTDGINIFWSPIAATSDKQDLSLTGNTLNITNGTPVDLNNLNANGQISGALNNLVIGTDAVTTIKIKDDAITSAKIIDGAIATVDLKDGAVSDVKISDVAPSKISSGGAAVGEVLKWNGTNWTHQADNAGGGSITAVTAGIGLTGGATTGNATLNVATDNTTITLNGSNQLQLANVSVSPAKVIPGANNTVLSTDATGVVKWAAPADSQNLSLAGNTLNITNGASVNLNTITVGAGDVTGPLSSLAIGAGKVTSGTILDGTIGTIDLANQAVTAAKLANTLVTTGTYGNATQVGQFTVDAQGRITDAKNVPITGASPTGAALGDLTGTFPSPQIAADAVTTAKIKDDAVTSLKIVDGTVATVDLKDAGVTPIKIAPGANSTVLTTDAGGVVKWASPVDSQNLSLTGNTLNITNGASVNLNTITVGAGDVTGPLSSLAIGTGKVTSGTILDGTIGTLDLANQAVTAVKLANTTVAAGTYGDGTTVPRFTVDAQGRITTVTNFPITGASPTGAALGDLTGLYPGPTISNLAGPNIVTAINNGATLINGAKVSANFGNQNITNNGNITTTGSGALSVAGTSTLTGLVTIGNGLNITGGNVTFSALGGGTNMVVANASGVLGIQPIPVVPATGNLTTSTTGVTITNGNNSVIGTGVTVNIQNATAAQTGLLTSADFTTFNNKVSSSASPATGDISGSYIAGLQIMANAVGDNEIIGISPAKINPGTANQVLVTNAGVTSWTNQSNLSPNLNAIGDVTGALNATTVARIQNIDVSTTNPTDQQVLQYNSGTSQWTPTNLSGAGASVAFKVQQNFAQLGLLSLPTKLAWDIVDTYDDGGNFSLNTFRAPSTGLYHFDAIVTVGGLDKNDIMELSLRVNSTDIQKVYGNTGGKNADVNAAISTDVKLNVNDQVSIYMTLPIGIFTVGEGARTQFSGRRIY